MKSIVKVAAVVLVSGLCLQFLGAIVIGCLYTRPNAEVLDIMADINRSGLLSAAERMMLNYDGRYFTNLLHGMNPVAYGYINAYAYMPLAAIMVFVLSVFLWLKTFLHLSFGRGVLAALLLSYIHFALSPDISSELFNLIAVYVYLYGISLWMVWTAAAYRYYTATVQTVKSLWFITAAVCLFASTGTNEQILLLNMATLFGGGILAGNFSKLKPLLPLALLGFISALFFVSCPGWRYRVLIEEHTLPQTEGGVFLNGLIAYWSSIQQLLVSSCLLFPFFLVLIGMVIPHGSVSILPFKKVLLWCGLVLLAGFAGAFIYLIGVQNTGNPPGRIFCVSNFLIQLCAVVFTAYLPRPFKPDKTILIIALVAFTMASLFGKNNYTLIISEYRTGIYEKFSAIYQKRMAQIHAAQRQQQGWRSACFDNDTLTENTIYYSVEMLPNRQSSNASYEKYFGIDEVFFCSDTVRKSDLFLKGLP